MIVYIQGDEPFIHPEQIDELAECISRSSTQIGTLCKLIEDEAEIENENVPKVLFGENGTAADFSRSAISNTVNNKEKYFKHIGIYGYKSSVLEELVKLKPSFRELENKLEQLRWLDNDFSIQLAITEYESSGIDTQEDLDKYS